MSALRSRRMTYLLCLHLLAFRERVGKGSSDLFVRFRLVDDAKDLLRLRVDQRHHSRLSPAFSVNLPETGKGSEIRCLVLRNVVCQIESNDQNRLTFK